MADVPDTEEEGESTRNRITDGYFEEEYHVDAQAAGEFLVELGEQLQEGDEITLTGDDWELPFAFGEPVELEIEFAGDGEPELEIEVELEGGAKDDAPDLA